MHRRVFFSHRIIFFCNAGVPPRTADEICVLLAMIASMAVNRNIIVPNAVFVMLS